MGEFRKMGLSESEVLGLAHELLDKKAFDKLRDFIWQNHRVCESESAKTILHRIWDTSLFRQFALDRGIAAEAETALSTSIKYKLRRKNPFPIEEDEEDIEMDFEQEEKSSSRLPKKVVKNARLPKKVHVGLNSWLTQHQDHPFPTKEEKEMLSSTLGITPQQVNRWFIQRRKMLRNRGKLYLGRGFAEEEEKMRIEQDEEDSSSDQNNPEIAAHFLFNPFSSTLHRQQLITPPINEEEEQSKFETSGGSMQILNEEQRMITNKYTPPPSNCGENEALDLSMTNSIKQEDSDFESFADELDEEEIPGKLVILEERNENLCEMERIAIDALMSLSKLRQIRN